MPVEEMSFDVSSHEASETHVMPHHMSFDVSSNEASETLWRQKALGRQRTGI